MFGDRRREQQEIQQVKRGELPIRAGTKNQSKNAEQRGIQRTPVGVDELPEMPADDCIAEIEIRDAVGSDRESRRPRLQARENEQDDPDDASCLPWIQGRDDELPVAWVESAAASGSMPL